MAKNASLLFTVEKEIALLLVDKLENYKLTLERAAKIARFVLSHLPENISDEQVQQIIPSLDDAFYELAGIVHKHMLDYEEKYREETIHKVEDLIKHNHFEQASKLAKDYFQKKLAV